MMRTYLCSALLLGALFVAPAASAITIQDCEGREQGASGYTADDPCAKSGRGIDKLVNAVQIIAGLLFGLVVLVSMAWWGMSGGNEKSRAQARAACLSGLAATALVLLADPIVDFLRYSFS